MIPDLSSENRFLFFTPGGHGDTVELLDLGGGEGEEPLAHSVTLPIRIQSVHMLNRVRE